MIKLIIPAFLDTYRSLKDKTLRLTFETNEPSPAQISAIQSCIQRTGYLAFKDEPFLKEEQDAIEGLKAEFNDTGKTPSQRLRGVLYRNFEQTPEGYETFEDYYRAKMEILINHWKNCLF